MPPKRSLQRTFSNNSNASSSSSSSKSKSKLKQNKLDFSFHSTSSSTRSFGSRPLSITPSFGLPAAAAASVAAVPPNLPPATDKGKQKERSELVEDADKFDRGSEADQAANLWSERLAPNSADELAIHPKKVAQVSGWLQEAFSPKPGLARHRKVLALTGPAGAGKSATIRALASTSDLDFDILEWHNDQPVFDPNAPGPSFIERFTDFLSKAAKFPTLDFCASDDDPSGSSMTIESTQLGNRRRVILLEDMPNLHHLPTKQLFQASIEQYIHQSVQLSARGFANVPIVLVVTESTPREDEDRWAGDSSGNSWRERIASIMDTRTALGESIRKNPAYTEVRFNPVAPTIILKGLKRAVELAPSSKGKSDSKIWIELLQAIAEDSNGDLRAAVNCLQFVGATSKQFETLAKHKGARRAQDARKIMRRLLPLVSGRESSLALFHALGKVLYNKRQGDSNDDGGSNSRLTADLAAASDEDDQDDNDSRVEIELTSRLKRAMRSIVQPLSDKDSLCDLPEHMSDLDRRASRVSPDQLWADMPVDSSVFQLYLHQNFLQFCTDIEQCEAVLEAFSTADVLTPLHEQSRHSSLSAYYSFLTSTRGTLLHLPSPVPRSGQKLGKATWWDVQKKLRLMLQDVDDIRASSAGGAGRIDKEDSGGGRFKRTRFNQPTTFDTPTSSDEIERTNAGLGEESTRVTLLQSNPVTLVTEILPLLSKVQMNDVDGKVHELARMRFEYAGVADMASRTLDEHETGAVAEDENEDETELGSKQQTQQGIKRKRMPPKDQQEDGEEEKLILSDDDIGDF